MSIETPPTLTTESGAAVDDNQNSLTAGVNGPTLLQDQHLLEKLARFNRERIPERIVHAVATGAYGTFTVTNPEIPRYTKTKMFSDVGKQTELIARFSTVAGSKGAPDSVRDPRGFAVKFYTEDGNWDLTGNNTPVFFIRDAIKFPDFIHSQKPDPHTNSQEPTNVWDFFSHSPEATHQFMILFSDRGLPKSVRHMNGYGSHTFQWVNADGERFWVKFHFKTDQGIANNTPEEAARVAGDDPEHHQHDLLDAIERGDHPTWSLKVQVMPFDEAATYRINPFDVTKVWPHGDYPLIDVGTMELNRTPDNYFAEVEQVSFDPGHMVPGVGPSPDKMLQARLISYADAARYRLGINHTQLPVNQPKGCPFDHGRNYGRDGLMQFTGNGGRSVNYEPNSFGGPVQSDDEPGWKIEATGDAGHYGADLREVDDFQQPGDLYRLMPTDQQDRTVEAIASQLAQVIDGEIGDGIRARSIDHFRRADDELGARLEKRVAELRAS